ncbi:MAG: hypothetical protein OEY34_08525, partial [Cyclobacteriaceae bacterium]|nr:hypothetical protein [Cyclobacteriaceae bacterium]
SPVEMGTATIDRPYDDFAQKSIALSTICGDPDYFYDFYIPFSDITAYFPSINSSTPLRFLGLTVINPHPAIGNNGISDLGGIDDNIGITDALWETLIDVFPPTSLTDLSGGGELLPRAACPGITGPIAVGATSILGTSTEVDGTTIEVFRNGISLGTTSVTGSAWTLSGISGLLGGDLITATASIPGVKSVSEANCDQEEVGAICSNPPTGLSVLSGTKGIQGSSDAVNGSTVTVYKYNTVTLVWDVWGTSTVSANLWSVNCGTGNCLPVGSYYATVQAVGQCKSIPSSIVCNGVASSVIPTISTTTIIPTTNTVSGTLSAVPSGSTKITLFINGVATSFSTTTTLSTWTISGISGLQVGDVVKVQAIETGRCPSLSTNNIIVQGKSNTPVIIGNYCTNTSVASVSGISSEPAGTLITLYSSMVSPVTTASPIAGTTTVGADGSWTITGLSLSANTYIAASAKATGELESNLSAEVTLFSQTVDGSLAITSSPIREGDTSISGTGTPGNTVYLYIDGSIVEGVTALVNGLGDWTMTGLNTPFNKLYAGGTATVTSKSGLLCESTFSAGVYIDCMLPVVKAITAISTTSDCETNSITIEIAASENLVVYQLVDQTGLNTGAAVLGTGGTVTLTTGQLTTSMTSISVKALRIGITCEITFGSTPIVVHPLPVPTITGSNTVCVNDVQVYKTKKENTNYLWNVIGGTIISGGTTADSTVTIQWNTIGAQSVDVNYTDINGCSASVPTVFAVNVNGITIALGTLTNPSTCGGVDGSIQLTGLVPSTSY